MQELNKEQVRIELRRFVDRERESFRARIDKVDAQFLSAPVEELPEGSRKKWAEASKEKRAEADAIYAQLYRFIDEA